MYSMQDLISEIAAKVGSTTFNRDHAAIVISSFGFNLGRRPRHVGATQASVAHMKRSGICGNLALFRPTRAG
jgi:hypothetical protein